jgi:hypothetical protein
MLILHKISQSRSEGTFLRSDNLLSERDPDRIRFDTLPDGDIGLRTPPGGGPIAEEHSIAALSDGTLYTVYRTIDGWPCEAWSRDGGHSWTPPAYMQYSPLRPQRVKHPRAAVFVWRCSNGQYLCWYHNHGGSAAVQQPGQWPYFQGRNPVWLLAGREISTPAGQRIEWSQPEIILYDDDPYVGMSYPDLIEDHGRFWISETQKTIGRTHAIDSGLLAGLFSQWDSSGMPADGLILEWPAEGRRMPDAVPMPALPELTRKNKTDFSGMLRLRTGMTLELSLTLTSFRSGQIIVDNRIANGQGFCLRTSDRGTLEFSLNDGKAESRWDCDTRLLLLGKRHHVTVIVDGGPCIILFVVDGVLNDGGDEREYGWGRFAPWLRGFYGATTLAIGPSMDGEVEHLRLYSRALRVSEAVAAYGAHRPAMP